MGYFSNYFHNIVIFMVFTVFISVIIPSAKYRPYINFVLGLALMSIVIAPITKILNINPDNINVNLIAPNATMTANDYITKYQDENNTMVLDEYKNQISNQIKTLVSDNTNITIMNVKLGIDTSDKNYGKINKINLYSANELTEDDKKNVKNLISNFYNLSTVHININI